MAIEKRVAARFHKQASWQGPFVSVGDRIVTVWVDGEFFGRVHHITGDLQQIERLLLTIKDKLLTSLHNLDQQVSPSDVYVNGLPGGNNRMLIEFYISKKGDAWSQDEMDAIKDLALKAGATKSARHPR